MKNLLPGILLVCSSQISFAQGNDSSRYYFQKAMEEKEARLYMPASKNFQRSIQFDPAYAEAYLQYGFTQLEMKRGDAALASFTKVYELQPSNKLAIQQLARMSYDYRQYDKAIEYASKCSGCENSDKITGMSYYQQEDYTSAEKYLSAAIAKNPADAEAMYTMGRNYLDMEEYRKAVPFYQKATRLDESKSNWMYELGLLFYNLNDFKNALASFKNAAEHGYTRSADFNENYGYAALYSGEYDDGENLLIAAWKKKPANKDILRDMAEILYKQKQFDRSLSYCQKLMEMDLNDGKALYQAGLCFQKKGEKDRGQQMCDKAIEMDPTLDSLRRKKDISGL